MDTHSITEGGIYERRSSNAESQQQHFKGYRSLDDASGLSYRCIGFTGELDLYVLQHRLYDEACESKVRYKGLKYRQMGPWKTDLRSHGNHLNLPPKVFTMIDDELVMTAEPRLGSNTIAELKHELENLLTEDVGYRLTQLFVRFVQPSLPILSSKQTIIDQSTKATMHPALLAAVAATAMPFITYDDHLSIHLPEAPSTSRLFRISWLLMMEELHSPHLSTIQTCLLLLQRHAINPYVPNTPFQSSLMGITIALAHSLGLQHDCTQWQFLPPWEIAVRKRLWWTTWTMEKWIALGEAVPSSLHLDDSDVEPLQLRDVEECINHSSSSSEDAYHMVYLSSLTLILDEIVHTYFTIRSVKRMSANLTISLEAARSLRERLKQWQEDLPPSWKNLLPSQSQKESGIGSSNARSRLPLCELNSHGSLQLAYLATQLTLFRALLRPVDRCARRILRDRQSETPLSGQNQLSPEDIEGSKAIIRGALSVIEQTVQFAEDLRGSEWDAFWHSCKFNQTNNFMI